MNQFIESLYYLSPFLFLGVMILALVAQFRVVGTMKRYLQVPNSTGEAGVQVAERMLRASGVYDVQIQMGNSFLGDHYNPQSRVIMLSPNVYRGQSITSAAVAAHEAGHAIQHAERYGALVFRNSMLPVVMVSNTLYWGLIFIGILLGSAGLFLAGIILFAVVAFFQLVTLPVEFDASARALAYLQTTQGSADRREAKRVLSAAAWTYVAALLISLLTLLRYILIFSGRRSRR